METLSLAVKYRPRSLADLVGQDHISAQIAGMFNKKRMPAAIMLHGATGLGKTTVARMIASMVNCKNLDPDTMKPCGQCASCSMSDHPDVLELNAADTRGIDDVRTLIQQSKNMPSVGNKRVFILDEAHQLTPQASQTLLKPIEEPPANTLWIICTMSPDKMLPAIAKRCLSLPVKPVSPELITKRLYRIAKREGVDFKAVDDGVKILKTIADFANGGVRESIQLLESVLLAEASGESIDVKTVLTKYLGGGEAELDQSAANLLYAILAKDVQLLVSLMPSDNARGVMLKMRWLLDYLINDSAGKAKFVPYSGRIFATLCKKNSFKPNLERLLQLQYALVELEVRLNSFNIDERVVVLSSFAHFALSKP